MARVDLGLAESEFWSLTPRELRALLDRKALQEERLDWRMGMVCAVIANVNRGRRGKRLKPQDFMPGKGKAGGGSGGMVAADKRAAFWEKVEASRARKAEEGQSNGE